MGQGSQNSEITTAAESASGLVEASWAVFVQRLQRTSHDWDVRFLTFPLALFVARSVAYFEVTRFPHERHALQRCVRDFERLLDDGSGLARHATHGRDCPDGDDSRALARLAVDQLAEVLWSRAAREILTLHDNFCETDAHGALTALRDALDFAEIDGARCCMMDGIEAFIADDLEKAAAIGAEAGVRDGKARDLINWLRDRSGQPVIPEQAGQVMDLVAWVRHEVAQFWRGPRDGLRKLDNAVGLACDRLLFRATCRELLIRPPPICNRSEIGEIRPGF